MLIFLGHHSVAATGVCRGGSDPATDERTSDGRLVILVVLAIVGWVATVATGAFLQWVPSPPPWVVHNRRRAWILAAVFGVSAITATAIAVVIDGGQRTANISGGSLQRHIAQHGSPISPAASPCVVGCA